MEQTFITVTEKAPQLSGLEESAARQFLVDYESYKNRIEDPSNVVQMHRCIEHEDLLELLESTTDKFRCHPKGGVAAALAAQPVEGTEEMSLTSTEGESNEKSYIRLSNDHACNYYAC